MAVGFVVSAAFKIMFAILVPAPPASMSRPGIKKKKDVMKKSGPITMWQSMPSLSLTSDPCLGGRCRSHGEMIVKGRNPDQ